MVRCFKFVLKEAGLSKNTHQIFLKFLDMVCLAIDYHLVMKNAYISESAVKIDYSIQSSSSYV